MKIFAFLLAFYFTYKNEKNFRQVLKICSFIGENPNDSDVENYLVVLEKKKESDKKKKNVSSKETLAS